MTQALQNLSTVVAFLLGAAFTALGENKIHIPTVPPSLSTVVAVLLGVAVPAFVAINIVTIRRITQARNNALRTTDDGFSTTHAKRAFEEGANKVDGSRYLFPLAILTVLCLLLSLISFGDAGLTDGINADRYYLLSGLSCTGTSSFDEHGRLVALSSKASERPVTPEAIGCVSYQTETLIFLCFTYIGWMAWAFLAVLDRAATLQLFPATVNRMAIRLIVAMVAALAMRHLLAELGPAHGADLPRWISAPTLAVAFAVGMAPEHWVRAIIDLTRSTTPKDKRANIPIVSIEGISPDLSFRLSEIGLRCAHDVANVNPFQLFEATGQPLMEVVDWIAQAQLLILLGQETFDEATRQSCRTIFDLVRVLKTPPPAGPGFTIPPAISVAGIEEAPQYKILREVYDALSVIHPSGRNEDKKAG